MKLFNKWEQTGIVIEDQGLKKYININEVMIPRTLGRNAKHRFYRNRCHIVERLMNKLAVPGHKGKKHKLTSRKITGKGFKTYGIVYKTFEEIEKQTKQNPLKIFVKALENAAPREEITTIEYGGARYPQSVDCSPQRRIDLVLRQMTQGAYQKSFNTKNNIVKCLTNEIINAYNISQNSQAISKKLELERQAGSSR